VRIEDATDVTVADNDLTELNQFDLDHLLRRQGYGIGVKNVAGATVSNNTVGGSKESISAFGWQTQSADVSTSDNELIRNGEAASPALAAELQFRPVWGVLDGSG